jgi:hypothetical protein
MLTRDRRYAERAADLLRIFFLDEKTRMNPNLNFGQAVPGHCDGRGIGIIDTRILPGLLDHVRLLHDAGTVEEEGLRQWVRAFNRWLRESPLGIAESKEHNNHGTWYDVQVAAFALYTGEPEVARAVLQQVPEKRINTQIAPDGSQPHEIARTIGLTYSTMNLKAFFWLARLGEQLGINLWNDRLRAATGFLLPFWQDPQGWQGEQIKPFDKSLSSPLLHIAGQVWRAEQYDEKSKSSWRARFQTV